MLLIADSGSTKTSWCLVDADNRFYFDTEGFNPYYVDAEYIYNALDQQLPAALIPAEITEVYYYGAGCDTERKLLVDDALQKKFTLATVSVGSDLLGAARALLGNNAGFAAILGTGTNSCIYNGTGIETTVDSLGFLLGDEGSGSYLGKKVLRDFIRKRMPSRLEKKFSDQFQFQPSALIESVYSKPLANRFCASFCKFLGDNFDEVYCKNLVRQSFKDFFTDIVLCYPAYKHYSFNCCGSVSFYFKEMLEETAACFGMNVGRIIKAPIEDLVQYHHDSRFTLNNY